MGVGVVNDSEHAAQARSPELLHPAWGRFVASDLYPVDGSSKWGYCFGKQREAPSEDDPRIQQSHFCVLTPKKESQYLEGWPAPRGSRSVIRSRQDVGVPKRPLTDG